MALLHANWIGEPPEFTPEQFQQLMMEEAEQLGIGDVLWDQYISPLLQMRLCPANIRAFALATNTRLLTDIAELEDNAQEREMRQVLQLVRAIGVCADCVKV